MRTLKTYVHSIFKTLDRNGGCSAFPDGASPRNEPASGKKLSFDLMMLCTYFKTIYAGWNRAKVIKEKKKRLDELIATEWDTRDWRSQWQRSSRQLEDVGFSPEFNARFRTFQNLMGHFYDKVIRGEKVGALLRQECEQKQKTHSQDSLWVSLVGRELLPLPADEEYKLAVPHYVVARAAKELVKSSPLGAAILEYQRAHPLHSIPGALLPADQLAGPDDDLRVQGVQRKYSPTILHKLKGMQSDRDFLAHVPYLTGSDAGEGDFYYAAFDMLHREGLLLDLMDWPDSPYLDAKPWQGEARCFLISRNISNRMNLVRKGLQLADDYTQLFCFAKRKVERYGIDCIGTYFVAGEVGEQGNEGRLRLFGANWPKKMEFPKLL